MAAGNRGAGAAGLSRVRGRSGSGEEGRSEAGAPLRVGIFVVQFPTPSETFIVTKVLGLLDAGIDVRIFSMSESPYWDRFANLASRPDVRSRVHYLAPLSAAPAKLARGLSLLAGKLLRHPLSFARFAAHNWRVRKENSLGFARGLYWRLPFVDQRLDILHVEFDTAALGVVDLKDFLGCRLLLSARGTFQRTSVPKRFPRVYERLFARVDGYHFISEFLRENTRALGLPAEVPSWLVSPAVDLELLQAPERRERSASGRPFRVLSVGRLSWEKGYEFAIDAVARLVEQGIAVEYTVLGEGDYEEAVRFAAEQHGLLGGVVVLRGAVGREEVRDYYRAADVLLHAAVDEGFCNAVLEAQAMGLPVVTTDAGGLPENVEDGVTGFVVRRRDPEALAEKLRQLALDPALAERMGAAGRERVRTHFALTDQVGRFVSLYRELAPEALAS